MLPPARGPCRRSGNGGPQTCLHAARSVPQLVAQCGPSSSTDTQDPREGPSLAGRTAQGLLRSGLTRQAHEEAERSRQGVPREVPMMQAMMIKTRRAPARVVSSFPLWCKGGKRRRSTEASSKGFPIGATRPRPVGRQNGGHHGAHGGVTARAFGRRKPPFVRIACTSCPLSNLAIVGSLPAQYLGRGPWPL